MSAPKPTAEKIRNLQGNMVLYKLSAPYVSEEHSCSFVRISYAPALDETAAFAAGEDGLVLSYAELPASMKGNRSHASILARMGYTLTAEEPVVAPAVEPFKRCGCGRVFATRKRWSLLPDAKTYRAEDGALVEQRLCPCGSHISVALIPALTVEELRRAVRVIDGMSESFNQDFTAQELLQLVKVCWSGEWDITPDVWTGEQIAEALASGIVPRFEESPEGLHAVGVKDCNCGACRSERP